MNHNIGLIGCGTMGTALLQGMVESGKASAAATVVFDTFSDSMHRAAQLFGVRPAASIAEVAATAEVIFIAVKPQDMASVLSALAAAINQDNLVVSIAAGINTDIIAMGLKGKGR